ncbi:MAG TPA: septal ring lytic transglycosylase RlpA family protein [Verrucomicrobiae bacterium]|jgi:rare lipoprotein A|nr:septal ring lytic transglycosylase RlpA family protein [Verrucomicrobiae bacterium]
MSGCGGAPKHTARSTSPPAPPPTAQPSSSKPSPNHAGSTQPGATGQPEPEIVVPNNIKPLYTEIGRASWYGPGFQNRHAANGELYDMNRLTAAHRTIPLNSLARVTNIKTGESVVLRITDRGPFVGDRVIDLSKASAKRVGVYAHGGAYVKIEVLQSPAPIRSGGKWCVQIGAFSSSQDAASLKAQLTRRYQTAKILQFSGPEGTSWLRIRVEGDDKHRAEELIKKTETQVGVFLVRLD